MRRFLLIVCLVACQRAEDKTKKVDQGSAGVAPVGSNALPKVEQIKPKLDLKAPPADAVKTSSGLAYKKLVENPSGVAPKRNDTVLINYTGWRPSTGETFFTNRSQGQPMPLNLATTALGFTEAMQLVKKGETVMLWIPPEIGYKGPPRDKPEMLVYEVEVVDVVPAPAVPPDVSAPPADAKPTKAGAKYVVVKPGGGKDKARSFDTVTFDYTAWDSTGRMFDSTEMRKRPAIVPPFRQSAVMEEILTTFAKGDRVRFWVDAEKMAVGGKSGLPGGQLCYELEMKEIEKAPGTPPPVPADVAAPPADAKKTAKGVSYKVLKTGKGGPKPGPSDSVKVHYTGWTTDGRMFDSSHVKAQPADFALNGVIAGWTDGIPVMSVGDRVRFWIPEELAYKGAPGKPQGMLVFEVELLEIKAPKAEQDDGHGHGGAHGAPKTEDLPPPPDVAAPPKDAKKSPLGVFYKILQPKKGAAHPTKADTVKVHYTGWTTDGKMFDSSVKRGQPMEFPLDGVITGWTDGIPMIGVGEKARLWIPQELAYQGQEGAPKGMLVFDVELIEIKKQ